MAVPSTDEITVATLAFLLTDIEGSMKLWEEDFLAMADALERHDALAGELIARHGGTLVRSKGEGDSVFAVFGSASDALACAVELQKAMAAEPWRTATPIRIRAAVDAGECQLRGGDYFGPVIGRCARMRAAAHGGQIVLSEAALRDAALPVDATVKDLGMHTFRHVKHAERILQLVVAGLPQEFPPLRSMGALAHNLPARSTVFVGRTHEAEEVCALIRASRLVTLVGPGGIGKTRLGLEAAERSAGEFADGVWFIDFVAINDASLVADHVLKSLSLREGVGASAITTIIDHLRQRNVLLVLDTCEHVCEAVAELVDQLLTACPRVAFLATSREDLGLAAERLYPVGPLCAGGGDLSEAVSLFVDRARAAGCEIELSEANRAKIEQICSRVSAMPLAIELAAARCRYISLDEIRDRLGQRLAFLTGSGRGRHERQRSVRAAIDWSYQLLSGGERRAFARLAVFPGSFAVDAATHVIADATAGSDALDVVSGLVAKSLVFAEPSGDASRYRLLDTLREYGFEVLEGSGEALDARASHAQWYADLASRCGSALRGPDQGKWLRRVADDHDDIREAWRFSLEQRDCALLEALAPVWTFWHKGGYLKEGRAWLTAAIRVADDAGAEGLAATLAAAAAALAYAQGDYGAAIALCDRVSGGRGRPLAAATGLALEVRGLVARALGDYGRARGLLEQSLLVRREQGNLPATGDVLRDLGLVAEDEGRFDDARTLFEESLQVRRSCGDTGGIALSLTSLGYVAAAQGELARARELCEQSLELFAAVGDRRGIALALNDLGLVLSSVRAFDRARSAHLQSLRIRHDLGDKEGTAECLVGLARMTEGLGDAPQAVVLMAAAAVLRQAILAPSPASEQRVLADVQAGARAALGSTRFDQLWTQGTQGDPEAVVLELLGSGGGAASSTGDLISA